ncbi:PAS domain-containing sensor histidine kinase [Mesonia aquimarina]|uniref:PAS domain-containing sensor histidine kinase n=1 Tax=Mesonia aquimarina TaxID=1504967 RepID=UPI000EF6229F|nr:PAS domain-containing sensor histidine kinase [Mesonia aquimarina]
MLNPTKEGEFNLERFFNLTPDILCIAGYDGYLKKVNPAFSNLLGYSIDELLKIPINNLIYEEDKKKTSEFRNSLKNKVPLLNLENRYITKNGDIVWLSWTSISEEENDLIYAVAKNITHIKKLEEERNSLLLKLAKSNADLKKFTYMISHDLRSPVSNVISLFSLLDLSKIEDSETRKYVALLNDANLEMNNTLNKYVDAVSNDKKINESVEKIYLEDVFSNVKNSINELVNLSNAKFEVDFSELTHLTSNEFFLQSILLNLISNSLKYSSNNRRLIISIKSRKINNIPQLIFSDNGIGFDMKKIGDKIFSLHQKFTSNHESRGIGLYLVKNLIETLGGSVQVESRVNVGTTFTLNFKA